MTNLTFLKILFFSLLHVISKYVLLKKSKNLKTILKGLNLPNEHPFAKQIPQYLHLKSFYSLLIFYDEILLLLRKLSLVSP